MLYARVIVLLLLLCESMGLWKCKVHAVRSFLLIKRPITHSLRGTENSDAEEIMKWPDPKSAPKLDFNEDFYAVLEVSSSADFALLKVAYKRIVFKFHPDRQEAEAAKSLCNKQMMVINNAYKVLKDSTTRKVYDKKRERGLYGNRAAASSSAADDVKSASTTESSPAPPAPAPSSNSYYWDPFQAAAANAAKRDNFAGRSRSSSGSHSQTSTPNGYEPQRQRQRTDGTWELENDNEETQWWKQQREGEGSRKSVFDRPAGRGSFGSVFADTEDYRRPASSTSDPPAAARIQARIERLEADITSMRRSIDTSSSTDWGAVTDVKAIEKRLEDLAALRMLEFDLESTVDELLDLQNRGRGGWSQRGSTPKQAPPPSSSAGRRKVDLWGDGQGAVFDGDLFRDRGVGVGEEVTWRSSYEARRGGKGSKSPQEDIDADAEEDVGNTGRDDRPLVDGDESLWAELEELLGTPMHKRVSRRRNR